MATTGSIRVEGLEGLYRRLSAFEPGLKRAFQAEVRGIAEPVAERIRVKIQERFTTPSVTAAGVRAGSRLGAATVRQRRGKTTGRRGDFGANQMRLAFIPGLKDAEPETIDKVRTLLTEQVAKFNS